MIKRFLFSILYLLLITMIVGVFHYLIIKNLSLFIPLINIYLFNFLMTVMGLAILYLIYDKFNDKVGFTFLGIGIIKMAIAVSFLMPLIKSNFSNKIPDTLNFFFCYFIFLIIESVFMVKLLNKKQ
jgi:hypothetical protein